MSIRTSNHPLALAAALTAMLATGAALAQTDPESADELVEVSVSVMEGAVAPGNTAHIAVRFDLVRHWHIYWKNAGATGAPTVITVKPPDGFTVEETLFPAPHKFADEVLGNSYGYEKQTVLFVPITASESISAESATFEVFVDYLVCKEHCLIGSAELELVVPIGDAQSRDEFDPVSKRHWDELPVPFESVEGAAIRMGESKLLVSVPQRLADLESIIFFPEDTPGVHYDLRFSMLAQGGMVGMGIPLEIKPQNARGKPLRVAGVITVGSGDERRAYAFDRPIIGDNHDRLGPLHESDSD